VKRQAVAELQKAVAAAEAKAAELITAERLKMDRTISEVRKQAHSEAVLSVGQQEDSSEVRSTVVFLCCTFSVKLSLIHSIVLRRIPVVIIHLTIILKTL